MADKSFTGLQLPNLSSGQARNASSGFARLYFKNDDLYSVSAAGVDTQLTGPGAIALEELNNVNDALNPSDNQVLAWDSANQYWNAVTISGAGGGLDNIVEDTTPQLGGNLDLNSFNITGTGDINITGSLTISDSVAINNYTLPLSDGSPNQVIVTDGSGTLSFADASGGSGISEELAIAYSIALG